MRPPFRVGTWRQGLVTLAGVLPVSLMLNLALAPVLGRLLPHAAVVAVDAAILVAALNWALLPLLHWATRGWAVRPRSPHPATGSAAAASATRAAMTAASTPAAERQP